MINLDCEGMGSGSVAMVGGELFGPLWEEYVGGLDSAAVAGLRRSRDDGSASSDFAPFDRAGCPSIAFWSRGDHPFYHHYEDDSRWISDSVMAAVGRRAEDFLRFLGNHDGSLACRLDSLRVLARMALNFDFGGFAIDPPGTFPESPVMTAAWLPSEAAATYAELIRRATELQGNCAARSVSCAGLKETIKNFRSHQKTVFMGMNEADLSLRRPAEVAGLIRQGLAVVRLAAGSDARALNSDAVEAARRGGVFALVPFDFNAAGRIERWKTQAVVTASLTAFAAAPPSVRDGLLSSDALLILDASSLPMRAEIETLLPGAARRVHLNFGSVPAYRREEQARGVIQSLFNAGLTREEILLLIGGNLRRFFDS
jgi:hypothetical protein